MASALGCFQASTHTSFLLSGQRSRLLPLRPSSSLGSSFLTQANKAGRHMSPLQGGSRNICSMTSGPSQDRFVDRFSQTIQPCMGHLHVFSFSFVLIPYTIISGSISWSITYCLHQSHNQSHGPINKTHDRLDLYP